MGETKVSPSNIHGWPLSFEISITQAYRMGGKEGWLEDHNKIVNVSSFLILIVTKSYLTSCPGRNLVFMWAQWQGE